MSVTEVLSVQDAVYEYFIYIQIFKFLNNELNKNKFTWFF